MVLESNKHTQESAQKSPPKSVQDKKFSKKCYKKVFRKALWLKNGLKKIIFSQKKAQQSFFGQRSSHKRECSKKYSKCGEIPWKYIFTNVM